MHVLIVGLPEAETSILPEIATWQKVASRITLFSNQLDRITDSAALVGLVDFEPLANVTQVIANEVQNAQPGPNLAVILPDIGSSDTNTGVLINALEHAKMAARNVCVCVPQDSVEYMKNVVGLCQRHGVRVLPTSGVHGANVAEYTLRMFASMHGSKTAENTASFDQLWKVRREILWGRLSIANQCIGVVGGAGKDGTATISYAQELEMSVVAIGSGAAEGNRKIVRSGAVLCSNLDELLERSDVISLNCPLTPSNCGMVGKEQLRRLKPGAVIVNPSGAELVDAEALLQELTKSSDERRLANVVFDKPYGWSRFLQGQKLDSVNAALAKHGVIFTPRVAGYSSKTRLLAVRQLAKQLNDWKVSLLDGNKFFDNPGNSTNGRRVSRPERGVSIGADTIQLGVTLAEASQRGASAAKDKRDQLNIKYKADGSPVSEADYASEATIEKYLRGIGLRFDFVGEEIQRNDAEVADLEIVADGIDGTRNFRDNIYGWCVAVAARRNNQVTGAAVYDPVSDLVVYGDEDTGVFKSEQGQVSELRVRPQVSPDFSFSLGSAYGLLQQGELQRFRERLKSFGGRGREWGSNSLSILATGWGGIGVTVVFNCCVHDFCGAVFLAEKAGAKSLVTAATAPGRYHVCATHPQLYSNVSDEFMRLLTFA